MESRSALEEALAYMSKIQKKTNVALQDIGIIMLYDLSSEIKRIPNEEIELAIEKYVRPEYHAMAKRSMDKGYTMELHEACNLVVSFSESTLRPLQ